MPDPGVPGASEQAGAHHRDHPGGGAGALKAQILNPMCSKRRENSLVEISRHLETWHVQNTFSSWV